MTNTRQRTPYTKALKPQDVLSKDYLAHLARIEGQRLEESRRKFGPPNQNVQMSIRMGQGDYLRFRALCRAMRKTNGDMLTQLMDTYLDQVPSGSPPKAK